MLLLSLWHAPIPWVHAHDLIGPSVEHLASLHRHVEEFHAGEVRHGEAHLDLHAHLILPWGHGLDPEHSPDGSNEDDADDEYLLQWEGPAGASSKSVGRLFDRTIENVALVGCGPVAEWTGVGGACLLILSRGRHFFDTFLRAASIRDLTGVRLC